METNELEPIDANPDAAVNRALGVTTSGLAIHQALDEEAVARKYVVGRYQALINRKHLNGSLTPQENEELEALIATLDEMEEPYYDAVIKRLRALVESGSY